MGQARSPTTDFLIDCYFNGFKAERISFWLRTMPKNSTLFDKAPSCDSALCHIAQSCDFALCCIVWNSNQKFSCWLRTQRGVNSALCRIARSRDSSLCLIVQSCDPALCSIARSGFSSSNRITPWIWIYMQNRFSSWIRRPRGTVWRKNQRSKISWDCPFKPWGLVKLQVNVARTKAGP
jgi:hypothetical protein